MIGCCHLRISPVSKPFALLLALLITLGGLTMPVHAQSGDPRPLYDLPTANVRVSTSSSLALAADGRTLVVANMLSGTVSLVDISQRQVLAELPTGDDPRSVALTPDSSRALVVNRGDGTLAVIDMAERVVLAVYPVGLLPYAVVTASNSTAYISLQGTSEVIHLDIASGEVLERIAVPSMPAGLALWGDFLYVTHFWSGQLSLVYLPASSVAQTASAGADSSLSQSLVIDAARGLAYLPQSRSNASNEALTFDTTIFPVVNVLDLRDLTLQRDQRIAVDVAARPVNMPFAAALDGPRRWLHVVNAGSDDLITVDLNSGLARAIIPVGANPRGVALSRDTNFAYVHNAMDNTITIIDVRPPQVMDVLPISDRAVPVDVVIGARLFHSAGDPRLSQDGWLSCASCHFDGGSDGRVWRGFPGGPRVTPPLYDLAHTAPYTRSGDWDDLARIEDKIRWLQVGAGLIDREDAEAEGWYTGLSLDLELLVAYLYTLEGPPAPQPDDPAQVEQGAQVFAALGCAACHAGQATTDGQRHDVGTGGEFVTPPLNWLWQSAPYFHDGRAGTLLDVFTLPGDHQIIGAISRQELDALNAYLMSLPD
jgi:YVTN family beta-propeller protein